MKPSARPLRVAKRLWYRLWHARRPPHLVTACVSGLSIRFPSSSIIGEGVYANAFERVERSILDKLVVPGTTVLDIGANIGFYACLFARRVGIRGRVLAFEPTPSVFTQLAENVQRNGLGGIVTCEQAAVSDSHGTAELSIFAEGMEAYNSLVPAKTYGTQRAVGAITVQTTTLDRVVQEHSVVGRCVVKIDVEGGERSVLAGGAGWLAAVEDVTVMVELSEAAATQCGDSVLDSLSILESCGYEGYIVVNPGRLGRMDEAGKRALVRGALTHSNVFFFNEKAARHAEKSGLL